MTPSRTPTALIGLTALLMSALLAGCSGGSDPGAAPTSPPSASPSELPDDADLTVVSFNVLGAKHTTSGGNSEDFGPGLERMQGALDLLATYDPDLVALQELQRAQGDLVERRLGRRYGLLRIDDNAVMWRRDAFKVLGRTSVTIPYFGGHPREMPVVRLRMRGTGSDVTLLGVHNPADVHEDATAFRAEAIARERAFVQRERARGRVVFVVGDFNDHEISYCALSKGGLVASANGGSNDGDGCVPPDNLQIDWIYGAGVDFTGFVSNGSSKDDGISDHPILAATVG